MSRVNWTDTSTPFSLSDHLELVEREYGVEYLHELLNGELPDDEIERLKEQIEDMVDMSNSELNSTCAVFSTADRILTKDGDVRVQIYSPTPADEGQYDGIAGWSDGKAIIFNADIVKALSENDVTALNGLNYHEICHLLYTPRAGSELIKWAVENDVQRAMNYLEDMRIETLFTARFPSTRMFLEANFYEYVANNDVDGADLFLLTRGRKYIPLNIRQRIADNFVRYYGAKKALEASDIIDQYRVLVFPRDFDKAKPLIERFSKLVGKGNNPQGNNGDNGDGAGNGEGEQQGEQFMSPKSPCENRKPMKNGRAMSIKEQTADSDKVEQQDKRDGSENINNDDVINNGDGEGDSNSEYNDNIDENSTEQDTTPIDRDIIEAIEKRAKDIREDEHVRREVRNFKEAVELNDKYTGNLRQARYREEAVVLNDKHDDSAEKFGKELERLQIEVEPTWVRETSSGRLNVERTMNTDINSIDRMFDRWQEADYSTEIEAVILLDNSGSMAWRITEACFAVWAIKRGLERIQANTTVYAFNSGSRVLYQANEPAEQWSARVVHTGGTTNPLMALKEAEQIFNMSSRTTKMLFVVTDGGFDHAEPCDNFIKTFNDMGVITSTIFIGYLSHDDINDDYIERYRHYAKYFNVISEPSDLVRVATNIVHGEIGVRA